MRLATLPLILLATPVMAETGYVCAFTVQCQVAGECVPVEVQTEIAVAEAGEWIFLSATATALPATRLSDLDADVQVFTAHLDDVASTLVTINPDGTALRTRHENGTEAATYFGICEVTG